MAKSTIVAAGLTALGIFAVGAHLVAQQEGGKGGAVPKALGPLDPAIRSLVEARIATAGEVYRGEMARYENTNMAPAEDLAMWSRLWMEDQLRLRPGPAGTIAAIQAHLERATRLEELLDGYAKTGQGRSTAPLKAKYFRLEVQQMLAEFRAAHPEIPLPASKVAPKPQATTPNPPAPPAK